MLSHTKDRSKERDSFSTPSAPRQAAGGRQTRATCRIRDQAFCLIRHNQRSPELALSCASGHRPGRVIKCAPEPFLLGRYRRATSNGGYRTCRNPPGAVRLLTCHPFGPVRSARSNASPSMLMRWIRQGMSVTAARSLDAVVTRRETLCQFVISGLAQELIGSILQSQKLCCLSMANLALAASRYIVLRSTKYACIAEHKASI